MHQVLMAIGNLVNIGNNLQITARAVVVRPIFELLYLLAHPAK